MAWLERRGDNGVEEGGPGRDLGLYRTSKLIVPLAS